MSSFRNKAQFPTNKDYPSLNYNLAPGDKIIQCPYFPNHQILNSKAPLHFTKCMNNYAEMRKHNAKLEEIVICQFNWRHHIRISQLEMHMSICESKDISELEEERIFETNKSVMREMMMNGAPFDSSKSVDIDAETVDSFQTRTNRTVNTQNPDMDLTTSARSEAALFGTSINLSSAQHSVACSTIGPEDWESRNYGSVNPILSGTTLNKGNNYHARSEDEIFGSSTNFSRSCQSGVASRSRNVTEEDWDSEVPYSAPPSLNEDMRFAGYNQMEQNVATNVHNYRIPPGMTKSARKLYRKRLNEVGMEELKKKQEKEKKIKDSNPTGIPPQRTSFDDWYDEAF